MSRFEPPVGEIEFAIRTIEAIGDHGTGSSAAAHDEARTVLLAAARLARDVFLPLNALGDREGCRFESGKVRLQDGYRAAYRRYVDGGWNGLGLPEPLGGQGASTLTTVAVAEIFNAANIALSMGTMPSAGAVELIGLYGSNEQKETYLRRIVSGEWTVTMAMTEPQAGSDLGAIRTTARRTGASYRLAGQKSLITWGEHDLAENIVHLVLARTPDGPPGAKGLSLFIVPKRRPSGDGELGAVNDVVCTGIERKMGLRGSPTATLVFGQDGGAEAELLGKENKGLEQMFVLMNRARINVAVFGLGSAERARQAALAYAHDRIQGRDAAGAPVSIVSHPDVRRMLLSMTARTEAARFLAFYCASLIDALASAPGDEVRPLRDRLALLTPVTKAWCTETAFDVSSSGLQVFGGIGYSEDCEASQHFREARVHMIYEGTSGVQANDLIFRKIRRDAGVTADRLFDDIEDDTAATAERQGGLVLQAAAEGMGEALGRLRNVTRWIVAQPAGRTEELQSNGAHYLMFFGSVVASWLSLRAAAFALHPGSGCTDVFAGRKARNARFMVEQVLPPAVAVGEIIMAGGDTVLSFDDLAA